MITVVLGALVACSVPVAAQQDNAWSTGGVAGSGSAYSSQVTPVGATAPEEMATTTYSTAPNRSAARRSGFDNAAQDDNQDTSFPIGSAWALLAFAAIGGAVVLRRRKGQSA